MSEPRKAGRELDAEVARALGWKFCIAQPLFALVNDRGGKGHLDVEDYEWRGFPPGSDYEHPIPGYSRAIGYWIDVEDAIESRGLTTQYLQALKRQFWPEAGNRWAVMDNNDIWRLIRAPLEQRCLAAISALTPAQAQLENSTDRSDAREQSAGRVSEDRE